MAWNQQANDVFLEALEAPSPERRAAYLAQRCGDDPELMAQVKSLLEASERAGSFLEAPAAGFAVQRGGNGMRQSAGTVQNAPREATGTVIGPYKLLQQIGEGGMGVVYMAEQTQPVQR